MMHPPTVKLHLKSVYSLIKEARIGPKIEPSPNPAVAMAEILFIRAD